jgi:hypothetical protein
VSSTQLQDELERSFGDGPPPPPITVHVESGRRALRRRRVATAALGMALVAGLGYAVSGTGPAERTTDLANDPTPTPSVQAATPPWDDVSQVRYRDGAFEVRPGAVVHERIDAPYGEASPTPSLALDLTFEGQRMWILAEFDGESLGYSSSVPSNGWASFADWVADQAGLAAPGDDGWPETLTLTDALEVVATQGTEILQRTDDPRLGETFAGPGDPTGAAVVRAPDGQSYFVVWRVVDGELDVITTPPVDVVGATFSEMLAYARFQYADGEGLR